MSDKILDELCEWSKPLKAEIADKDQKILQLEDELVKAKEDVNRVSAEELEQLERAIAELKTIIMAQEDESNE